MGRPVKRTVTVDSVIGETIDTSTYAETSHVMGMVTVVARDGTFQIEWRVAVDWPKVGDKFNVDITKATQ